MNARDRYAPVLAAPSDLEDFDAALAAVVHDQLADRITAAQAVDLDGQIRHQREEFVMQSGG